MLHMSKNNYNSITPTLQHSITPFRFSGGFTLVEVSISVVLLGLIASVIMYMYSSAYTVIDEDAIRMPLDGYLRSRMELLAGKAFAELSDGSEIVTVKGQNYTINWSVAPVDLDGDTIPEPTAKQVNLSLAGSANHSLTIILIDHEGLVGKI
jgi:prepilin-type N-terminal cleavage/methylation domain-containing protein